MELKKKIVDFFNLVPVATREQLEKTFFDDYLNPTKKCQTILKELHEERQIFMNKRYRPFICFSKVKKIPQFSSKLFHHIDVVQFYLEHTFQKFEFEPSLGYQKDGFPRPDCFVREKDKDYFVEVQTKRKHWTKDEVKAKIKLYEKAYRKKKYEPYSIKEPTLWFVNQPKVNVFTPIKIRWEE